MPKAWATNRRTDHPTDADLVRKAADNNRAAFGAIYQRYVRRIYNLVLRMVHHDEDVEDITQEIFLQVYRNLPTYEGRSSVYTWIYRVATNTCLQYRKKLVRRRDDASLEGLRDAGAESPHDTDRGPEASAERRQMLGRALEAIQCLPRAQRLVIVLGPIQGHTYEEIAEILCVSVDVVKGRLHRARNNLYRNLEERPRGDHFRRAGARIAGEPARGATSPA